jgi:hypothetical protein
VPTFTFSVRESVKTGELFDRETNDFIRAKGLEANETDLV